MKEKVLAKIKEHIGHQDAIGVEDLIHEVCIFPPKISDKECRDLVVELIFENHLILSCAKGYYVPITDEDFAIGKGYLTAPFEKMKKRITQVEMLWAIRNTGRLL